MLSWRQKQYTTEPTIMLYQLGIIGAGNMAEAIVGGVIRSSLYTAASICAADLSTQRLAHFAQHLGVATDANNANVVRNSRVVLLSVKPQQMKSVLSDLAPAVGKDTLLISIAAGVSTASIEAVIGPDRRPRVIRCMPNTPMLVGEGMAVICGGRFATADDLATATTIFSSAAKVMTLAESAMDAVTAVSGSGPAYFFFLVEQMIAAGVSLGLEPSAARTLATQTLAGAAKMLTGGSESPQTLRQKVTSPNGTTHAAITHLQSQRWPEITIEAVTAAARRSRELSGS